MERGRAGRATECKGRDTPWRHSSAAGASKQHKSARRLEASRGGIRSLAPADATHIRDGIDLAIK